MQDEKTGSTRITPVRIEITAYYPAPLPLSDSHSLLGDEFQLKLDDREEATIDKDPPSVSAQADSQLHHQVQSPSAGRSPSTVDGGPRQVTSSSPQSATGSLQSQQADKRQMTAKKSRVKPTGPAGSVGSTGEEQIFNYVIERFDDDAFETTPLSPAVVQTTNKEELKKSAGKKKSEQEQQVTGKPTTDESDMKTAISDVMIRRLTAQRLWNEKKSSTARSTVDRLSKYVGFLNSNDNDRLPTNDLL